MSRFAVQRKATSGLGGEAWLTIASYQTRSEAERQLHLRNTKIGGQHRIHDQGETA